MHRQLNLRLLVGCFVVLVPVAVIVHCVHGYQVRQCALTLRSRGDRAVELGQPEQALAHYTNYLGFVPDDASAREKYIRLFDRVASPADRGQVAVLMQKLLLERPDLHDVRFRFVHNLIFVGRIGDAAQQIGILTGHWDDPAELKHMLGWCQEAREQYAEAAESFRAAVRLDPKRLESAALLALVLERLGEPDEGKRVLDAMVEANPNAPGAYLIRYRFHLQRENQTAADRDLQSAVDLAPDQVDVALAAADRLQARGKPQEAFAILEAGVRRNPHEPYLYKAMADLKIRAGERAEAVQILARGLDKLPLNADLLTLQTDLRIDQGDLGEAVKQLRVLRKLAPSSPLPDYLQGRIAIANGQWSEATAVLERCRKELASTSAWSSRLHALLGTCYHQAGDAPQELAALRLAVLSEPGWAAARVNLGAALLAGGRVDDAVAELQLARDGADAPKEVWSVLARALLYRNLRLPEAQRDWSAVESAVVRARKAQPDAPEVTVLQAEVLIARKEFVAARAALQQALDQARSVKGPGAILLWCALAELAERQGQPGDADRTLERAEAELGDGLELRLARCRLWANRGDGAARKNLAALADGLDKLSAAARTRLCRELADAWARLGDPARAEGLWRQVAAELLQDVRSRSALLDIALQTGQAEKARTLLAVLRTLEGSQGMQWRGGTAALRLLEARADRSKLAEARKLLTDLERQYPDWGRVPILQARADELGGSFDAAARHYERAVELGERQPVIVHRLVELLLDQQEYLRAEEALGRFTVGRPLTVPLARLGAEVAAGNRNGPVARARARQAVPLPSHDYRDYLWVARIDQEIGEAVDAEAALRESVRLAGHAPDTWIALVEHLGRTGQSAAAESALAQAREALPAAARPLALARCHEALHQLADAEANYAQALAARPDDFMALIQAAEFYARQDRPDRAEPLLRRLLMPAVAAPAGHAARARRQLAAHLAARGKRDEALTLLTNIETAADERVRLYVVAQDPAQRSRSIAQFQESLARQPASPADRLLLADLFLAADNSAQACTVLQPLAMQPAPQPQHVARYVRALIHAGDLSEAAGLLTQLQRWEPQVSRTRELRDALTRAERK